MKGRELWLSVLLEVVTAILQRIAGSLSKVRAAASSDEKSSG